MKITRSVVVLLISYFSFSQHHLLDEISLTEKAQLAEVIVEGQVVDKKSYWDEDRKNIYTVHTVSVSTAYKGDSNPYLYVVSLGGVVGLDALVVKPSLDIKMNSAGVFLTEATTLSLAGFDPTKKLYQTIGASQGFYKYDIVHTHATNPFQSLKPKTLSDTLKSILKTVPIQLKANDYFDVEQVKEVLIQNIATESPVIYIVDPLEVVAGNESTLIITGLGFGDTSGSVFFKNADDGGSTYIQALQTQIISWTDTEIVVEVPGNAGSGIVLVQVGESTAYIQAPSITVTHAFLTLQHTDTRFQVQNGEPAEYPIHHIGGFSQEINNPAGSFSDQTYVFTYNEDFIDINSAVLSFEDGFDEIVCHSGIRFEINEQTTTQNTRVLDDLNVIAFDSISRGVLGQTTSRYSGNYVDCSILLINNQPTDTICNNIFWYTSEIDFIFNNQISWDFDLDGNTSSTEFDFNAVLRHEIGHAAGLGHVINEDEIMHYAVGTGSLQHLLSDPIYSPVIDKINNDREAQLEVLHFGILATDYSGCYSLDINAYNPSLPLVEIYPNPTGDYLYISVQRPIQTLDMFAVNGEKVTGTIEIKALDSSDLRLNLSSLSSGTYFLILQIDNKSHTKQIVKNEM